MKKICLIFLGCLLCAEAFGANVRSPNAQIRQEPQKTQSARQTTTRSKTNTTSRNAVNRTATTQKNTVTRTAVKRVSARTATTKNATARTAVNNTRVSRATKDTQLATKTFSTNYTECRDAYFTCMDQFCANQNDTYRRCVCSSRLQKIQEKEGLISQTSASLQDFHMYNIDAIPKTAEEVMAMQSATDGEKSIKQDKSNSATTLKNIKEVLNNTQQKSLSTQGTLDIAGDIKEIWKTTDLIHGNDIATLSGEALYNAVNAQCYEMVSSQCMASDLKMVASAYGMYIENDCEALATSINNSTTSANASIRKTRHEMQDARLENYNAHNALSINECVVKIKEDITADTACGQKYVHCLDLTGKYLNIDTGEPIYSPSFYEFENQISLSGDVLKNSKNKAYVNMLNNKRKFAKQTLDSCRDVADDAWDEFLRQSLVEISQEQRQRIQTVKHDCLQVVNQCYLDKAESLQEFADGISEISTRYAIELSEAMCTEKLSTCSNLYGGGSQGLALLVDTMSEITDTTITQECPVLLDKYVKQLCAVPVNDSTHSYPYGCRAYAPGEAYYATTPYCNKPDSPAVFTPSDIIGDIINPYALCPVVGQQIGGKTVIKIYTKCKKGFFLCDENGEYTDTASSAVACCACWAGYNCEGGTKKPKQFTGTDLTTYCGDNYIGSLYQKLVIFAANNCTRTTDTDTSTLPETILQDITTVMTTIQTALAQELSKECARLNGIWVDMPWVDKNKDGKHDTTNDQVFKLFYTNTNANKSWGYCKQL